MPRQNRVNPFGELIVTPARGMFMGNRGVLHDNKGQLTSKRWSHNHWIICLTEFRDSKENPRPLMAPGCYTELFFLDEATALAAGHRPCAECRREDFNRYKRAWIDGNLIEGLDGFVGVGTIDQVLHRERVARDQVKVTFEACLGSLPDGVFVEQSDSSRIARLIWKERLWAWASSGYDSPITYDTNAIVDVLTPTSTVNAIAAGYLPQVAIDDCLWNL